MIEKIKKEYLIESERFNTERSQIEEQIEKRRIELARAERSIERNEAKLSQLKHPSWIDGLVNPIAEYFAKEFDLDYEVFGPFGIRAQVTIYWRADMDLSITEQPVNSLSLIPGDLSKGELYYQTGEEREGHGYARNSIGYLNGFHKEVKPLPDSLDDIRDLINVSVEKLSISN